MKKLLVALTVMAIIGTGCSTQTKKEADHGHPHEGESAHDESVPHEHDGPKEEAAPNQEEFTIGTDTASVQKTPEKHSHDGKTDHEHH